jgi:spermidine/putrescine transport system substrate-binding protein
MARQSFIMFVILLLSVFLAFFSGCTAEEPAAEIPEDQEEEEELSEVLMFSGYGGEVDEVIKKVWLEPFEEETGITVIYGTYGSQEEVLSHLNISPGSYDIIRPSDVGISRGVNEDLLEPLRIENIPNIDNINPEYRNMVFDAGDEEHGIPLFSSFYVLAKLDEYIEEDFDSYAPFFDEKYEGKIALRDYGYYRIQMTAAYLGYDPNNMTEEEEEHVFQTLEEQHKLVHTYWRSAAEIRGLLASGEVWLADWWNDAAISEGEELGVTAWVPEEGIPAWTQQLAIAKDSPNRKTAEMFLNWILEPENMLAFHNELGTAPLLRDELWDRDEWAQQWPLAAEFAEDIDDGGIYSDVEYFEENRLRWEEKWGEIKAK